MNLITLSRYSNIAQLSRVIYKRTQQNATKTCSDGRGPQSQSQTISVPEAKQRSLQDGCSSNTSHIWQLRKHPTKMSLIFLDFGAVQPSAWFTMHRITTSRSAFSIWSANKSHITVLLFGYNHKSATTEFLRFYSNKSKVQKLILKLFFFFESVEQSFQHWIVESWIWA